MKRLSLGGLVLAALVVAALTGCVSAETLGSKPATGVWGYVASSENAALEMDQSRATATSLLAKRVLAPADGFLVATVSDGSAAPPMQVGFVPVKRGESSDLIIPTTRHRASAVVVTLYVDKGQKGELESEPMNPTSSPDRPVFVNSKPLASTVVVTQETRELSEKTVLLSVFDQPESNSLKVTHVVTPGPSWIVVYADDNGKPGRERGRRSIEATDALGVTIKLKGDPGELGEFVALYSDEGLIGDFNYSRSSESTEAGVDRPYVVEGVEVMKHIILQEP